MLKRTLFIFSSILVSLSILSFLPEKNKKQQPIKTVIIDAGHGGSDGGAKGEYSYEKDICLDISLKLGEILTRELPNIKFLYTRTTDSYPTLSSRANFANQSKGDLFLCIHVNAAPPKKHSTLTGYKNVTSYVRKKGKRVKVTKKVPQYRYWTTPNPAKGTETYIWGAHKNEDKEVAMRENAPMLAEENFTQNYGDIDPNSPEFIALSLLKTKQYFKRSATLAGFVQDEFAKVGRIDRDVRQRSIGIWVLQATAMPSILVETGYITNRSEEDYLNSDAGQKEIAHCITRAVKTYISWLEKNQVEMGAENTKNHNEKNKDEQNILYTEAFLRKIEENEETSRIIR